MKCKKCILAVAGLAATGLAIGLAVTRNKKKVEKNTIVDLNDLIVNADDMIDELPAVMIAALYDNKEGLSKTIGRMEFISYNEDTGVAYFSDADYFVDYIFYFGADGKLEHQAEAV